jgi:hypothetical protein
MRLDDKSVPLLMVQSRCLARVGSGRLLLIPKTQISIAAYNTGPGAGPLRFSSAPCSQKN